MIKRQNSSCVSGPIYHKVKLARWLAIEKYVVSTFGERISFNKTMSLPKPERFEDVGYTQIQNALWFIVT